MNNASGNWFQMNGALTKYECLYTCMYTGGRYSKRFGAESEGSALEGKVILKLYAVPTMNNDSNYLQKHQYLNCVPFG